MEAFCFSVPDTKDARSLVLAGGGSLLQAWLCQAPTVVKVPVCCGCPSRWAQSCLLQGAGAWLHVILGGGGNLGHGRFQLLAGARLQSTL